MEYGFKHTTSSPYHPKGNGRAEAAVKVAETMLKKADDFHSALLLYRNTPPQGHTYSPAQRMFLRHTKTILPTTDHHLAPVMINFSVVEKDILKKGMIAKHTTISRRVLSTTQSKLAVSHTPNDHPVIAANPGSMGK